MILAPWKKHDVINGNLARLRNEMDRTFERFLEEPFAMMEPKTFRSEAWFPPLDLSETDSEVLIRAETPGIPATDLDITVEGHTLIISGEKDETEETKKENYYQCERRFGSFRRVVELPESADADKIDAEADNGIVTIHVAKKPGLKPKQVQIKAAGKKIPVKA